MRWGKLIIGLALALCLAGCGNRVKEPPEVPVEPSEAVESTDIVEELVVEATEAPEPVYEPVEEIVEEPESLPQIYEGNELINLYLTRYNEANPEEVIGSSDFEVYYHHGSEHKDQIAFTQSEVIISAKVGGKIQVVVEGLADPEEYKEAFIRFTRGYGVEGDLEAYWVELLDTKRVDINGLAVSVQYDYDNNIRMLELMGGIE